MVPTSLSSEFTAVVNPAMAGQVAIGRHAMSSSFTGSLPSISETEENDYLTDCQAVHSFFGRIGRQLEISALTRFALLFSSRLKTSRVSARFGQWGRRLFVHGLRLAGYAIRASHVPAVRLACNRFERDDASSSVTQLFVHGAQPHHGSFKFAHSPAEGELVKLAARSQPRKVRCTMPSVHRFFENEAAFSLEGEDDLQDPIVQQAASSGLRAPRKARRNRPSFGSFIENEAAYLQVRESDAGVRAQHPMDAPFTVSGRHSKSRKVD